MRLRCVTAVVLLATLVACSSDKPSASSSSSSSSSAGSTTTTEPAAAAIGHVFVINLENKGFEETWGAASPASFLNSTLRPKGQLLTQYFGTAHFSLGNYIAQISGQAPNAETQVDCITFKDFVSTGTGDLDQELGSGCVYPAHVKTIADQLTADGKTWRSYQEDIGNSATEPKTCRHPVIGEGDTTLIARQGDMYASRHNPFVYFHSIIDDQASCDANVVGFEAMAKDFANEASTPNLAYITPNLCHDGHDTPCVDGQPGGLVSSDETLKAVVPMILASPAFQKDGLLVVTFDEAEVAEDSTACCNTPPSPNAPMPGRDGPGGGRVGALLLGPSIAPGTENDTPYNHYSLLCSMEDAFGYPHLGFAGAPGLTCFGKDVYAATAKP